MNSPAERAMFDQTQATPSTQGAVAADLTISKDNHTIGNDPQRVIRWVQIAREEAEAV